MRSLSLIVAALILSVSAWSQQKVETLPSEIPTNIQKPMKVESQEFIPYKKLYIIDNVKKMMTYFDSGQIPVDFPKYDHKKTEDENFENALTWVNTGQNIDLLTSEAIQKLKDRGDL
ncbi:MAG: hypothetical protein ACI9J3_000126 [Parvicellaceae bacterium]|jgi:hypothetical protein